MKVSFGARTIARTTGSVLVATALSAGLALPAAAAVAAPAAKTLTVSGTVDNVSGHAEADAVVKLYAWPVDTVLQALKPGHHVPTTLLASAKASPAGAYTLHIPAASLVPVTNASGYVNFEVDSGMGSWSFTSRAADVSSLGAIHIDGASPAHCSGWVFIHQVNKAWGIVGQAYILHNATHVRQKFTYSKSQSTTLGIGDSPTAKLGSFSISGSESESTTGSESFPSFGPGNALYRTRWRMAKYKDYCTPGGGHGAKSRKGWHCTKNGVCTKYRVRSDGWQAANR